MHTSSSPQSLKNWICRGACARTSLVETKGSRSDESWRATYRLLHRGWPALVQHRPALRIVDLEAQGEADGSDVICRVLQQTNISRDVSSCAALPTMGARRNSRKRGREVCSRRFVPCGRGQPAGSAGGSCHQTAPGRTASGRPAWRKPTGLRTAGGTDVSVGHFSIQPFLNQLCE